MNNDEGPKDRPVDQHLIDAVENVETTAPKPNIGTSDTGAVEGDTSGQNQSDEQMDHEIEKQDQPELP